MESTLNPSLIVVRHNFEHPDIEPCHLNLDNIVVDKFVIYTNDAKNEYLQYTFQDKNNSIILSINGRVKKNILKNLQKMLSNEHSETISIRYDGSIDGESFMDINLEKGFVDIRLCWSETSVKTRFDLTKTEMIALIKCIIHSDKNVCECE